MRKRGLFHFWAGACTLVTALATPGLAAIETYVSGPVANSSNTISTASGNFNSAENLGLSFTPGGGGPFTINQITFQGVNSTPASTYVFDFKIDLRGVSSGLPDATLYATDSVSISVPAVTGVQTYTLGAVDLVNIATFDFVSGTNYSLVFYKGTVNGTNSTLFSIGRSTSVGVDNVYTTTNGFAVTSTFRNGIVQPTNKYSITLDNVSAVPEPSTYAAWLGAVTLGIALCRRRSR
jgi:hypothetical protein